MEADGKGFDNRAPGQLLVDQEFVSIERADRMSEQEAVQIQFRSSGTLAQRSDKAQHMSRGLLKAAATLNRMKGKMDRVPRPGQGIRCTMHIPPPYLMHSKVPLSHVQIHDFSL